MTIIRITLAPDAVTPLRGSAGSSGYDLYATTDTLFYDNDTVVIDTGVRIELPDETWEAQVRPRSSITKRGLIGAIGSIDSDYRGSIGVVLTNVSGNSAIIKRGDRIAQLVFARVEHPALERAAELSVTARGTGGFGSSGR